MICNIRFFDSDHKEIKAYNPLNSKETGYMEELGPDQQIIGIYGGKKSLGFILKVKEDFYLSHAD